MPSLRVHPKYRDAKPQSSPQIQRCQASEFTPNTEMPSLRVHPKYRDAKPQSSPQIQRCQASEFTPNTEMPSLRVHPKYRDAKPQSSPISQDLEATVLLLASCQRTELCHRHNPDQRNGRLDVWCFRVW